MKKYKMIVFDLDGTLLDTIEDLTDGTNYALTTCGLPKRSLVEVRRFVGNGIRKLIERAVPEGTAIDVIDKVFETFRNYYTKNCQNKTKPYGGIMDLLDELKNGGYRTAILSNKNNKAVQRLSDYYFSDKVDAAMGQIDSVAKKPAPDMIEKLCEDEKIDKCDVFYVGDSEVDYQFSTNAGIDYALVSWGFRDKDELMKLNPWRIFDTVDELKEFLMDGRVL